MRHLLASFPLTITFGRPGRAELLVLAGALLVLGSGAGWLVWAARAAVPAPAPTTPTVGLVIESTPSGAAIVVDDQPRGVTSAVVDVVPGQHVVRLSAPDAIAETRQVDVAADGARLDLVLWRARPAIHYLKPTLPGAALVDARFLADGRVGLVLALPGAERQVWTLDPDAHLASQPLGGIAAHAPLAIRADGQLVAVLEPRADGGAANTPVAFLGHAPLGEVWLIPVSAAATPTRSWTASESTEDLVDLEWAPDGQHLIVVGRQPTGGGAARTAIHWLDATTGEGQDLALLPSEVAPGSYVWSPDSQTVGFVVHTASLAAVCTLSVAGEFHYFGDLGHDGLLGPPVAPVAWAPDGRVLYGALVSQQPAASSRWPLGQNPAGLFLADPPVAPGHPFSSTAALAPLWRADGRTLALGLPSGEDSSLWLRELDAQGNARDVATIDVPAPGPTAYGVRWDLAHRRALVVTNRASGEGPAHDYWLVDFGWGAAQ